MIRRSEKSCKEGVCSIRCFRRQKAFVHVSAIMHLRPGHRGTCIWGGGVCTFGALQPTANFGKKMKEYLFSEGYLFTGFYSNLYSSAGNWKGQSPTPMPNTCVSITGVDCYNVRVHFQCTSQSWSDACDYDCGLPSAKPCDCEDLPFSECTEGHDRRHNELSNS